jgi:hypothetical protein
LKPIGELANTKKLVIPTQYIISTKSQAVERREGTAHNETELKTLMFLAQNSL